jgi:sortase (surface protein transpeptidase)
MEYTIYQNTAASNPEQINFLNGINIREDSLYVSFEAKIADFLGKVAKYTAAAGAVFMFISFAPSVFYSIKGGSSFVSQLIADTVKKSPQENVLSEVDPKYQPRYDATLPKENMLIIPSIGIETKIGEAPVENFEEVLKEGVWRAPDFSTPYERKNPTILAAHRYGYLSWSNLFRKKSSFYNLPKLEEGEVVKVIWRQREYVFEVYATQEGEKISDYSADLILYTCESLNSPERIFKYARLLEI